MIKTKSYSFIRKKRDNIILHQVNTLIWVNKKTYYTKSTYLVVSPWDYLTTDNLYEALQILDTWSNLLK